MCYRNEQRLSLFGYDYSGLCSKKNLFYSLLFLNTQLYQTGYYVKRLFVIYNLIWTASYWKKSHIRTVFYLNFDVWMNFCVSWFKNSLYIIAFFSKFFICKYQIPILKLWRCFLKLRVSTSELHPLIIIFFLIKIVDALLINSKRHCHPRSAYFVVEKQTLENILIIKSEVICVW
jgi:hypothetical protein